MNDKLNVLAVIPARYQSSRFPGKPLASIQGKPLIIRVAEKVLEVIERDNIIVATDDHRIHKVVNEHGFLSVDTSENHLTGTDRVAEVAEKINADVYLNIQGDEPLIDSSDLLRFINAKVKFPRHVINGFFPIEGKEEIESLNVPKVVFNGQNDLIYMSRLPIPGSKTNELDAASMYKQVCIYAFNKNELMSFHRFSKKPCYEEREDIEILRFFELGIPVKMVKTSKVSLAVDIPEDILKVENAL